MPEQRRSERPERYPGRVARRGHQEHRVDRQGCGAGCDGKVNSRGETVKVGCLRPVQGLLCLNPHGGVAR